MSFWSAGFRASSYSHHLSTLRSDWPRDSLPITHPEFYYGFLSVALAWQIAFLVIAADPIRFRPMMVVAIVEKFGYVTSIAVLYGQGSITWGDFTIGVVVDAVLGALFLLAFVSTRGIRSRTSLT